MAEFIEQYFRGISELEGYLKEDDRVKADRPFVKASERVSRVVSDVSEDSLWGARLGVDVFWLSQLRVFSSRCTI